MFVSVLNRKKNVFKKKLKYNLLINKPSGFLVKIFDMSNIFHRPTTGLIRQADKPLWLTNDLTFILLAVNLSLTTVQWKDGLYRLAID